MTHHPIVALWSHPRSMSTATERIMRERGDFTCFHEPFLYDYYLNRAVREMPMLDGAADQPRDYRGIRGMLLAAGERAPVFFKDMSYYVVPHIFEDEAFARRLTNTFLIRDPLRSIVSYHRLDPEITSTEVGLIAQWEHVSFLRDVCGQQPCVIEAEAISADPRAAMRVYWQAIGVEPLEQALSWQPGVPGDWRPVAGWHQQASSSTGIRPQPTQAEAQAAFGQAAAGAPHLEDYLEAHAPAYRSLRACALRIAGANAAQ